MRKKSLPEVMVCAVTTLYDGAKTKRENGIWVFTGIQKRIGVEIGIYTRKRMGSENCCTLRVSAVVTIVCNNCERYYI